MIIFEYEKYIANILKNGISKSDKYGKSKIKHLCQHLIKNTQYKKGAIINKIMRIAKDYLDGLPEEIAKQKIEAIYDEIKESIKDDDYGFVSKEITLYKSEMENIKELDNYNEQKIAFVALVFHKWLGQYHCENNKMKCYQNVAFVESDINREAQLDNLSGTTRKKIWQGLHRKNIVDFSVARNYAYNYNSDWIVKLNYTMRINKDIAGRNEGEEIYCKINDYSDLLLYLDYFLDDEKVTLCSDCGRPIVRAKSKRFCSECGDKRKKESDKRRKKNSIGKYPKSKKM